MDISLFAVLVALGVSWLAFALAFDEPLLQGLAGVLFIIIGSQTLTGDVTLAKVLTNNTTSYIEYVSAGSTWHYGLIFILFGATLLITAVFRMRGER